MAEKTANFFQKTKKCPYGMICGGCAIFVFFATIGLIVGYVVSAGIAAQTNKVVSFVEELWQQLLLSFDIIIALTGISAFVFFVLKKVYVPYDGDDYIEVEVKERGSRRAKFIKAEMMRIFPELMDRASVRTDEIENKMSSIENELAALRTQVDSNTEYLTEQKQEAEIKRLNAQKRRARAESGDDEAKRTVKKTRTAELEELRMQLEKFRGIEAEVAKNAEFVAQQKEEHEKRRIAAQKRRENKRKEPHAAHVSAAKQIEDLRKELDELRAMLIKNSEVDHDNT